MEVESIPEVPIKPEHMAMYMSKLHGTSNPWQIIEDLGMDIDWTDELHGDKLGRTSYMPFGMPIIHMAAEIRHDPVNTRVLAHELGHALLHNGVANFYRLSDHGYDKSEREAERFAAQLLTQYYVEEYGRLPETLEDIQMQYGL
jgi:Zn-dependent peptidase ImmA (M78 family)